MASTVPSAEPTPAPLPPPGLIDRAAVQDMIGRAGRVNTLLHQRAAHIAAGNRPAPYDIPPPNADGLFDAREVALWALRMGWHTTGIGGGLVIGYLGLSVESGLSEQWFRQLARRRTGDGDDMPPPRWVIQIRGSRATKLGDRDEWLQWAVHTGRVSRRGRAA